MIQQEIGAPRKSRRPLWFAVAAVLVVAVAVAVFLVSRDRGGLTAAGDPAAALLNDGDFGGHYDTHLLDQRELGEVGVDESELPPDWESEECARQYAELPQPSGDHAVAAVQATAIAISFVELVSPAGDTDWDVARAEQLVDECGTVTFPVEGETGTVTFERVPGLADGTYALFTTSDPGTAGPTVYYAVAAARVKDYVVVLAGVGTGEFDRNEFVRLAGAARQKAAAQL